MSPANRAPGIIVAAILAVAAIKLYLAASLGLFQDEAFYWMESQRLAPSYSDIPPLTAFAIRAGAEAFGASVLGARSVFLAAGAVLPLLMYWFARPIVGARDAWWAAGCSLLLPLFVVAVGPVAVADSLMIPICLVFLGAFERATRTRTTQWWWLAGIALALGFLAHYRFAAIALGGIVYLLFSSNGRSKLRTPGPWLAAALGSLGLLPILWFSFAQDHQALEFQFIERHPWTFKLVGLKFVLDQALLVTPLLFGFLVAAWIRLGREARRGDDRSLLLWLMASCAAGTYFALSPFTGLRFETFHWPLMGYLPLLPILPGLLRSARRWLARATLALAIVAGAGSAAVLVLQANMDFVYQNVPGLVFRVNSNFVGWREMADRAKAWIERLEGDRLLLVGDHYVVAGQLEFHTGQVAYTTEPWKLANDGRAPQVRLWGLDEAGLAAQRGRDVLVVYLASERGRYTADRHQAVLDRMCRMFERVEHLERLELWGGNKVFDYYLGANVSGGPAAECPDPVAPG